MSYSVRRATVADVDSIRAVQRHAFGRVAAELGLSVDDGLPALRETSQDLVRLLESGMSFWVAEDEGGRVIGSVRAQQRDEAIEIGRLVVDDGWERQGVGMALMDALEDAFADACVLELFTGADAAGPLALYLRRGYQVTRTDAPFGVPLVWLQKRGADAL